MSGSTCRRCTRPALRPTRSWSRPGTWDNFLKAAEKCFKAGHPFGLGLSTCTDAINMAGAVFHSYGADLVDAKGNITVKTDATRQALELFKQLAKSLDGDVFAYDNASNNKALVSGKSALIFNPPSAYAVAKRDQPKVAEQLWTFHSPKGPKGRYDPSSHYYLGDLEFLEEYPGGEKPAGLSDDPRDPGKAGHRQRRLRHPALREWMDFKIWEEEGPPEGHQLQLSAASTMRFRASPAIRRP